MNHNKYRLQIFKNLGIAKDSIVFLTIIGLLIVSILPIILYLKVFFLMISALILLFFRSPLKKIDFSSEQIISPCDGVIMGIDKFYSNQLESEAVRITIFLSLFNVHLIHAPIMGCIKKIWRTPGKNLPAFLKSSENNNSTSLLISGALSDCIVIKRTGLVARRIKTYVNEGTNIMMGDYVGLIRFGSRVELVLPSSKVSLKAKLGDKVVGAKTVVAVYV